ncbi:hypothetical protein MOV66_06540 [Agrobacterium sp. SHOUNA12C]|nr:hypothetical protein [Agrobacterium sp. BETTINA12B]MCJ9756296.1 hypothetical protein [Agrobacterium sp. SHOUNA12C]
MTDPERGTGLTKAMVEALPESGGHIIVHSAALREYVRKMVLDIKGADVARRTRIHIVRYRGAELHIYGMSGHIAIDHAWQWNVPGDVEDHVYALVRGAKAASG